jgi:ribonuclease Z
MDIAPTEDNISRLLPFISDADHLYCEAFFSEAEAERALQRNHLTAAMAGRIAKMAGVKNLTVMHFSQKYNSEPDLLIREAEREFRGYKECQVDT